MLSNDFIDYLTASGFTVYPDADFIPADLPENRLPCLFVMDSGGYAPHNYVPTEKPTWQVIIKGKSYKANPINKAATEELAKQLVKLLHRKANYAVGNTHVFSSLSMQQPIYIGLDDKDRPMYSTNFMFYTKEATQ